MKFTKNGQPTPSRSERKRVDGFDTVNPDFII
jgi:hypothetical protein